MNNRAQPGILNLSIKNTIPLHVFFELTRKCNLRCVHCYIVKEKKRELSTSEIKEIIDQLRRESSLILNFSGGEIFTRPDFLGIARYARKKGFAVKFFTNGTLIDRVKSKSIAELRPLRVEITIFSTISKIHDGITGVKGSLDKSLRALHFLSKEGVPLRIKCPLLKQNVSGYRDIIRLARDLGSKYQFDPTVIPKTTGALGPIRYRVDKNMLFDILQDPDLAIGKDYLHEGKTQNNGQILCSAGHNSCAISAYGDLLPCVILPIKLGGLKQASFAEIWRNSKKLRAFRALGLKDIKSCRNCTSYTYCTRCPGHSYLEEGSVIKPTERSCEIAEILSYAAS